MKKVPYIFILDIDNTIIGDIYYISKEYSINKEINDICRKDNYEINFEKELKEGFLRPYLKEFLDYIHKKFAPCEVYLYTNSSYGWTNGPLVKNIEKVLDYKFSKPYFTREDSINYKKSLTEIYDKILKSLKKNKKYDIKILENDREKIVQERMIFIDDIENNLTGFRSRQLNCPKYEIRPYRDIYKNMLETYGYEIVSKREVRRLFYEESYHPYYDKNGDIFDQDELLYNIMKSMHMRICELYKEQSKNDDYFKVLIENLNDLSDKTIKKINNITRKGRPPKKK